MATAKEEDAVPDFLRMDQAISSDPANVRKTGNWYGWPTKGRRRGAATEGTAGRVRRELRVLGHGNLISSAFIIALGFMV
jgi:hypothetical protein